MSQTACQSLSGRVRHGIMMDHDVPGRQIKDGNEKHGLARSL